jgi:hypothetical protein
MMAAAVLPLWDAENILPRQILRMALAASHGTPYIEV